MQPEFLSSGDAQTRSSGKWMRWTKILGRIQNGLVAPDAANNPKRNDSLWAIKQKILRALQ